MMRPVSAAPLVAVLAAAILAGCAKELPPADEVATAAPADAPNVVEITGGDYFFEAPDTIPAGATTFRLKTNGKEMHHVQLMKLAEGKTMADFMKESAGGEPPRWAIPVGGPNAPIPGVSSAETAVDLEPGNYALICLIPSPDGRPHVAQGMSRSLVVAATESRRALPEADITFRLTDYAFDGPDSIAAGKHVIRVENLAEQPHEILLVKLEQGKAPEDLATWAERMEGPPPAAPFGGTTGFIKGVVNVVSVDLPPGDYGLLCFLPDAKDGKPHVAHGMMRRLKVG